MSKTETPKTEPVPEGYRRLTLAEAQKWAECLLSNPDKVCTGDHITPADLNADNYDSEENKANAHVCAIGLMEALRGEWALVQDFDDYFVYQSNVPEMFGNRLHEDSYEKIASLNDTGKDFRKCAAYIVENRERIYIRPEKR